MTNISPEESVVNCAPVCPIGEGCTEVVLKDDEGNEQIADLAELRGREGILDLNKASLNIDHSNDVIVGPVTQFYAPVTIYQNVNGQINGTVQQNEEEKKVIVETCGENVGIGSKFSSIAPSVVEKPENKGNNKNFRQIKFKHVIYLLLITLLLMLCLGTFYIIMSMNKPTTSNPMPLPLPPGNASEPRLEVIYRDKWGGWPPKGFDALVHPVPLVIIKHTAGGFSTDFETCCTKVRNIQADHQTVHNDIDYNFLICGDENVYVGRGWDVQNAQRPDSIDISFMGNFIQHSLSPGMIKMAQKLIEDGVAQGKIAKNYKLVAHKQTKSTQSPGTNVIEEIKKWPHYYPGKL